MKYEVFTNRNKMKLNEANTIKNNCNMSKKLLLTLYIALLAGIATAQVSKTVNCTTAGTLYTLLTKTEYTTITNLTVTGNIDVRDVHFMRDSMTVLAVLNLEAAQIKAYGTYADNAMPDSSFYRKVSLTNIKLPESLTSIGDYVLYICYNLTGNLTIPDSVISIGNYALSLGGECIGFTGNLTIPNSVISIGDYAFNGSGFTGYLTIPNSVTYIGESAFYACGFTGNLIVPSSITNIGERAFNSCKFTGNLTIPNTIISIGDYAFAGCQGFTHLTIPSSVTAIGDYAFFYCSGLQKITVGIVVPLTITDNMFYNVNKTTCELSVPKGSKAAYQAADYWKDFVKITESIFVFFNSQGGSAVGYIISKSDTFIAEPSAPNKTGYTFAGWYKEIACNYSWNFDIDSVTTDTTLYAKWIINSYTVSFNSQGGSAVADLPATYNTTITEPIAPTKTGFTFAGWYKEAVCTNAWTFATDVVTANTTLYAKWIESTSIRDNTSTSEIKLYPNPATDYLVLKIEGEVQTQCIASLYDMNGKLVESKKLEGNETSIVLSNLVPATYFLKVAQTKHASSQQQIKTFKIIKK